MVDIHETKVIVAAGVVHGHSVVIEQGLAVDGCAIGYDPGFIHKAGIKHSSVFWMLGKVIRQAVTKVRENGY